MHLPQVSIVLEELADAVGLQYDAWRINIGDGAQFTSGFVNMNPNSKIPSLVDKEGPGEEGLILLPPPHLLALLPLAHLPLARLPLAHHPLAPRLPFIP